MTIIASDVPTFGEAYAAAKIERPADWPMGQTDPLIWAKECRVAFDKVLMACGIPMPDAKEMEGFLLGWFANAMASADPKVLINDRGNDNELRKLRREFVEMGRCAASEIKMLRQTISTLQPKADAYDVLTKVVHHALPGQPQGYSEDIAWRIERQIEAVEATNIKPEQAECIVSAMTESTDAVMPDVAKHQHEV